MNQILINNVNINKIKINGYKKPKFKKKHTNPIWIYKYLFLLSIISIIISISYIVYGYQNRNRQERLSESLYETFNISTLYAKDNSYKSTKVSNGEDNFFSVVGIIKIDTIKISYPILSNISDEFLKISPCRFYGPLPNEIGNMCVAAHNYDDNRFFSKIGKLKKDDIIIIYDNTGRGISYSVFSIYETKNDDVSCTIQETNNKREITLVTCTNLNGNRIIVKARENNWQFYVNMIKYSCQKFI